VESVGGPPVRLLTERYRSEAASAARADFSQALISGVSRATSQRSWVRSGVRSLLVVLLVVGGRSGSGLSGGVSLHSK
jgi:hypothetical protein